MKLKVIKLDGASAGSVELGDDIFGLDPRVDILHRVVRWQRNKAQAGTHKVKTGLKLAILRRKFTDKKVLVVPATVIEMLPFSEKVVSTRAQLPVAMLTIFPKR